MHCVLVAAIIVKELKWTKKTVTRSIFNQIESICHQILEIPRHFKYHHLHVKNFLLKNEKNATNFRKHWKSHKNKNFALSP